MRVISGSAKRLQLKTIEGKDTRPTTDRIKETLFNILALDILDSSILDLFSGSGAIGIEALSRGAKSAVFVEKNKEAIKCIKENLKTTSLEEKAQVLQMDYLVALDQLEKQGRTFDIIFMDPPYGIEIERHVLEKLSELKIITEKTIIIVESAKNTEFSYVNESNLEIYRTKEYKTNKHIFLRKKV